MFFFIWPDRAGTNQHRRLMETAAGFFLDAQHLRDRHGMASRSTAASSAFSRRLP